MAGTGFGRVTRTRHPDVVVEVHDRGLWRVAYRDACGEWSVTGPPYRSQVEAFTSITDEWLRATFGEPEGRRS